MVFRWSFKASSNPSHCMILWFIMSVSHLMSLCQLHWRHSIFFVYLLRIIKGLGNWIIYTELHHSPFTFITNGKFSKSPMKNMFLIMNIILSSMKVLVKLKSSQNNNSFSSSNERNLMEELLWLLCLMVWNNCQVSKGFCGWIITDHEVQKKYIECKGIADNTLKRFSAQRK